jgi:hypothetical protein
MVAAFDRFGSPSFGLILAFIAQRRATDKNKPGFRIAWRTKSRSVF